MLPSLVEVKDGLLASPDKDHAVMMKARDPELFPDSIKRYFSEKTKVLPKKIEVGTGKTVVKSGDRKAVFDSDLFEYMRSLGRIDCYLSNVPLPCEDGDYYPLFAKYKYGWVVLSPLGA